MQIIRYIYLLLVCFLAGCTGEQENPHGGSFERSVPVVAAEVIQQDVPVYVEAIGNVAASKTVDIRPQVSGKVVEVFMKGGDAVKPGDPLYRIDPTSYQVELDRAKANFVKDQAELDYAQKKLERYVSLLKNNYVSELDVEELARDVKRHESQLLIDKTQIETAKIDLDNCCLFSPTEGKLSLTKMNEGNLVDVHDSNQVINILKIKPVHIYFSLPQKEFQSIQNILCNENCTFKVCLPYDCQQEFEGHLEAINNSIDSSTGTIQLKGSVANESEILWPGEFVRVKLLVNTKKNASLVPSSAIQTSQKGTFVYILKDDMTVDYVPVKIGETVDHLVVIDEGVKAGMKVITDGQLNLRPGSKVVLPK